MGLSFILNISMGSVSIPFSAILDILAGKDVTTNSWQYIILQYRLPKALTAILVGAGLSLSGLLMQTLFRNPLAGPFVLGISSGASLGAAFLILGAGLLPFSFFLEGDIALIIAAATGSFLVLLAVLTMAAKTKDSMSLLIIGLMFGSITAAVVSVLSYFSNAEKLQQYIFWSFGSLGNLSWNQLAILTFMVFIGIVLSVFCIKNLNALLLGESYAKSMGIKIKRTRILIIIATGILAGSITAFAGPIAFIGLAVPHIARQIFNSANHKILMLATMLIGAILLLLCDVIAQLPGSSQVLPINAITSIIGAPVVIWLLIRKNKIIF